jgi:tyrosyl-tRNA synthetase
MADGDLARLLDGAAEVISERELAQRLEGGRPLRVKLGIDPSRPDLHLGHTVVLRKLRRFQDLGHTAVLIIGDFTGRVGDPTGQSEMRPLLSEADIESNARTYFEQAGKVLDIERAEVRRNSEWLSAMTMDDLLRLMAGATVARMLERDDFQARYRAGRPISVVEFLYPLMQAMDSVQVRADVEMGGTDQTFNLLMGRDVQREHGQEPQVVLTMPLLEGTDGKRKMSKSLDNYVGVTDPPDEMFGRLMRVPDELIPKYLLLCTDGGRESAEAVERGLADGSVRAVDAKRGLAGEIVRLYHGERAAKEAQGRWQKVHSEREIPEDMPQARVPPNLVRDGRVSLVHLVAGLGLAASNSEARRLVHQGGVRLDGEPVADPDEAFDPIELGGRVLSVGRRRFVRLLPPAGGDAGAG